MASGTANSPGPTVVGPATTLQHEQFIEQQLSRTRRRVKWVDLGSMAMGLIGGIIAYLMVIVTLDHWVTDLGKWGRLAALLLLLAGVIYYVAAFLVPPILRRINPVYAARAIEQSDPSFKNSLINLLMFRRDASPTGRLVYQALRQRAARDLRHVNVDLAVDRTKLIHIGYIVVGLMVLFAVYTVLSPKDVFRTVLRVAAPWADIARPSRVSINDVTVSRGKVVADADAPMTLIYGDRPTISARIQGVRADDSVTLHFSTADAQTVDRAVPMECPAEGQRYACILPPEPAGLQQSLTFWIEAGDAVSLRYHLAVSDAPTILIEKITYQEPAYTFPPGVPPTPRVVANDGEIKGLEGTYVTIEARANHKIKDARIEFAASFDQPSAENVGTKMDFNGTSATYSFRLQADEKECYRLSFTAANDLHSEDPMIYRIRVSRDLLPEISILAPRETEIELPADSTQRIEIRALDPDFGLSKVEIHATARGEKIVQEDLLAATRGAADAPAIGQKNLVYDFSPSGLGLAPGDRVTYWAVAVDNRPTKDDKPESNSARTSERFITIVAPANSEAPQEGDEEAKPEAGSSENPQEPNDQADPAAMNQQPSAPGDTPESSPAADPGNSGDPEQSPPKDEGSKQPQDGEQQPSEQGQQGDQPQQGAQGQQGDQPQEGNQGQQQGQQGDQGEQGNQGQTGQQAGGAQSDPQAQPGQDGQGGAPQQGSASSGGNNQPQPGQQGMSQAGSGAQGSSPSPSSNGNSSANNSQQPAAAGGQPKAGANASPGSDTATGAGENGQDQGAAAAPKQPAPSHDGEAVDRALQHLQDSASTSQDARDPQSDTQADPQSSDAAADATGTPNPADQPQPSSAEGNGNASDRPGTAAPDAGGQGNNPDPRDGEGKLASGTKEPKAVEGSEASTNPDTGPQDKQSGAGAEGSPGSGESSEREEGSPSSHPDKLNKDRDKSTTDPDRDKSGSEEATTPDSSHSDRQSDSQGDTGGKESGGGEQGGGQSANQAGRDSPGSNMASEQGNAGSPESGQGETAQRGGDKQLAPDATGQSGQESGAGSQTRDSAAGKELTQEGATPQQPNPQPGSPQGPPQPQEQAADSQRNESSGGMSNAPPQGGGLPGDEAPLAPQTPPTVLPEADAANLEYARKATDLVLERLKDQQNEPDPALLDAVGWTQEEMQQFIARWEELKRRAREEGPAAEADLQDALRSLGLRPTNTQRRSGDAPDEQPGGQRDLGRLTTPPPEFLEQFNAYKKGRSRGKQ